MNKEHIERLKVLSDALTQYLENMNEVDESTTSQELSTIATAEEILEEVNLRLASLAEVA